MRGPCIAGMHSSTRGRSWLPWFSHRGRRPQDQECANVAHFCAVRCGPRVAQIRFVAGGPALWLARWLRCLMSPPPCTHAPGAARPGQPVTVAVLSGGGRGSPVVVFLLIWVMPLLADDRLCGGSIRPRLLPIFTKRVGWGLPSFGRAACARLFAPCRCASCGLLPPSADRVMTHNS